MLPFQDAVHERYLSDCSCSLTSRLEPVPVILEMSEDDQRDLQLLFAKRSPATSPCRTCSATLLQRVGVAPWELTGESWGRLEFMDSQLFRV